MPTAFDKALKAQNCRFCSKILARTQEGKQLAFKKKDGTVFYLAIRNEQINLFETLQTEVVHLIIYAIP